MTAVAAAPVPYAPPAQRARHYPQLDGVRAVAVLLVVASHTLFDEHWTSNIGADGVRLFFVLSGFLITGILLRERDRLDAGGSLSGALWRFYARRALRIFPAYYLLLAILLMANVDSVRADWPWHALYGTNWMIVRNGGGPHEFWRYVGHLWSLSVEEQFYLAWPLLVFTLPRSWLDRTFVGAVTVAVVVRGFAAPLAAPDIGRVLSPTPASLDALALGALLSWRWSVGAGSIPRWIAVVGLALVVHGTWLDATSRGFFLLVTTRPLGASLLSFWIVDHAARGDWRLLLARPLRYMGRISYGMYLWHMPALWVLRNWHASRVSLFAADLALTLCLAALSWHLVEAPINRLKSRFPYP